MRPPHDCYSTRESRRDSAGRSNATVRASRFGVAVLPARIQAAEHDDLSESASVPVHHSWRARALSGSELPRRSSICPKVRTTLSAYRFVRYAWSGAYLPGTLAVVRSAMPRRCSATGRSDVARRGAIHSRRLIHFHMRGSARFRDNDPCIHLGEIDTDAAFTGTRTHVDGGSVFRIAEASLQFRLRLTTDWTLVRRRRSAVENPHGSPRGTYFHPRLERRDFVPATLMRLAAGAGREAQERDTIIRARTAPRTIFTSPHRNTALAA